MSASDERELELLLQQLKENTDIDLRCHAAQQLGLKRAKASVVVPALIEALNDDNWLVRVEAATALSKLGRAAESAIESLTYAMNEPRNRPKRGQYYEAIQALKLAQSEEPEIITPSVVVEEPKEEVIPEDPIEEAVVVEETPVEPVIESTIEPAVEPTVDVSEEVIEDVAEEPIVEEVIEEVTPEVVEEAKDVDEVVVDDFVMDEETEDIAEDIIDEAFDDADEEFRDDPTPDIVEEVVEEIADDIAEEVIEPAVAEEEATIGEDITEIVEDVSEDITKDTTDEEIIEEAIEEIAEEVLEDVLEDAVGDTVDHEIIDDIAEEITEEVLEKDDDDDDDEVEQKEPTETFQAPIVEVPEEEKKTTEAVSLEEVLEFEDDKKKLDGQPPAIVAPTVEEVKTVKMSTALLKIVLVGDAAVGKTAFRKKYCDAEFSEEYREIIGADFATKHFTKNGENFAMQIWDIAAKERFQTSKELFFKSLYGAVLIFDVTNRESFKNIHNWLEDIQAVESKEIAVVLVGNKIDLRPDQEAASITREEGQELAAKLSEKTGFSISYVETSVETGAGVEVAFRMLEERIAELFFSARDK